MPEPQDRQHLPEIVHVDGALQSDQRAARFDRNRTAGPILRGNYGYKSRTVAGRSGETPVTAHLRQ